MRMGSWSPASARWVNRVPATTTIADLHAVLQAAFGWADEHLHRFVIQGREYGISYPGGVGFRDNPRRVSLAGFGLRAGERFVYDHDFIDGWRHDIRSGSSSSSAAVSAPNYRSKAVQRLVGVVCLPCRGGVPVAGARCRRELSAEAEADRG